jgi:hypothetical protein
VEILNVFLNFIFEFLNLIWRKFCQNLKNFSNWRCISLPSCYLFFHLKQTKQKLILNSFQSEGKNLPSSRHHSRQPRKIRFLSHFKFHSLRQFSHVISVSWFLFFQFNPKEKREEKKNSAHDIWRSDSFE